jgi:hypothetical protein
MTRENETLLLRNLEGSARKTGTDQHWCVWTEFRVDYLAEQEDGECCICGRTLSAGWVCLDGAEEVCDEHVRIVEQGELDVSNLDFLLAWEAAADGFLLALYDTGQTDRYGKSILGYQFWHEDILVFEGDDFHCSPSCPIDSDQAVASLLAFLSLKPGDTDPEYFEDYTPGQLEFAVNYGEALSWHQMELEELVNLKERAMESVKHAPDQAGNAPPPE